jgi:hypothetical protein
MPDAVNFAFADDEKLFGEIEFTAIKLPVIAFVAIKLPEITPCAIKLPVI